MTDSKIPLSIGSRGPEVKSLHATLAKIGQKIPKVELEEQRFGPGTRMALLIFQNKHNIPKTGNLDDDTRPVLELDLAKARGDEGEAGQHLVEGQIFFDNRLPAGGIVLRACSQSFGGADLKLGETKTDEDGFYAISYKPSGGAVNLELRTVGPEGKEIPLSRTKFNAERHELLNLVAPSSIRPLATEYERLISALQKELGDLDKLADARETADRQDITLLRQSTGWDARIIALAAKASRLRKETGMKRDALYALSRIGLPTDKRLLAQAGSEVVDAALRRSREAGIVALNDGEIAAAVSSYKKFARKTRLTETAPGTLSSYDKLLSKISLTKNEKETFIDLYFSREGNAGDLWQKAIEKGIPEEKVNNLRLQGKLAYLTLNNAPLTKSLQDEIGSSDNLDRLVEMGLHKESTWKDRLRSIAGGDDDELDKIIPTAFRGKDATERLDAYAASLSRMVCYSFPTQTICQKMTEHEIEIVDNDTPEINSSVATFLKNASKLGLELGRMPLESFIRKNKERLLENVPLQGIEATINQAKRIHRLYQLTPSDQSLKATLSLGFSSAQDIVVFSSDDFVTYFSNKFPSVEETVKVYNKAQQVSSVIFNFLATNRQLDSSTPMLALSAPSEDREAAKSSLVKQYPILESLFGSLDFCECDHCRSVLSPAAYFVDLLKFTDPDNTVWDGFKADWKGNHGGKAYDGPSFGYMKPYDALIERRPDLPHLPLTCENTHTVMPYIDLVNEILEYYVAWGALTTDSVHDTGSATTPDLLAEPQNICPQAYAKLKRALFPLALPYDLWLQTVRMFLDYFETPLWKILEVFCLTEKLFPPTPVRRPEEPSIGEPVHPTGGSRGYYRSAIFAEYLGISSDEQLIFTDSSLHDRWFELYGYSNATNALVSLSSAKTLSRRLKISYKELIGIIRTSFINPGMANLAVLKKLGLDIEDVFRYKVHAGYLPFSQAEKSAFECSLKKLTEEYAGSEFNAREWLNSDWEEGVFNRILVLADPEAGCNFDKTTLRYADGRGADALVFLKINLFVRLWKKLAWMVNEIDNALIAFIPRRSLPTTVAMIGNDLRTALIYISHLEAINKRANLGKDGRLKLLTLWSDLPANGEDSLYAQLFLKKSILQNDPIFDDPLGRYLAKSGIMLKDHIPSLQAALNLSNADICRIIDYSGESLDTAELSMTTISLIYRYGLLARALKISINDLLALKSITGINPFEPLVADGPQPSTKIVPSAGP